MYSADSEDAIRQVVSGSWNNWHTTGFIGSVWLFTLGGKYLSIATLVNGIILAITVGFLYRNFLPSKPNFTRAFIGGILIGVLPQIGVFGLTLWKDVLYTVGCIWFLNIQINKTLRNRYLYLFLSGILIASFRWNGFLVIIFFEIIVSLKNRKIAIKETLILTSSIIIGFGSLLAPPAFGIIDGVDSRFFNSTRLHDIAVTYVQQPEVFSSDDEKVMARVAPIEDWIIAGSQCLTHDNLMFTMFPKNAPNSYMNFLATSDEFIKIWNRLLVTEPIEIIKIRICRARSSWDPTLLSGVPQIIPGEISPEVVKYGIKANAGDTEQRTSVINAFTNTPFKYFWSAPFLICLYLLLMSIKVTKITLFKRRAEFSLATSIGISILASTALSQVAQDLRYNFSVVIIILVVLLASIFGKSLQKVRHEN